MTGLSLLSRGLVLPLMQRVVQQIPLLPDDGQALLVKSLELFPMGVTESEANGIFAGDIVLRTALVAGLADLRANPHFLDYVFASLPRDPVTYKDYGEQEIAQAKAWFLKTAIPVSMVPRLDTSTWPRITIALRESSEAPPEASLGDVHYIPDQENSSSWPTLTGKFTPESYVPSTGVITLADDLGLVLAEGQNIVDYTGRAHKILEVYDDFTFAITPNTVADFRQSVIKSAYPGLVTQLESSSFKETYTVGVHTQGKPVTLTWLHAIVQFILLRYKEALLEARGFERSTISSSDFGQEVGQGELTWTRYVNVSGYVRQIWPKAIGLSIGDVDTDGIRIVGLPHAPDESGNGTQRLLWKGEEDDVDDDTSAAETVYYTDSSPPYISSSSSSSSSSSGGGGTTTVNIPVGTITPLTWYVETSGSDVTGTGDVGSPFATVDGALTKLRATYGDNIRHLVDLRMGAGNFPGFRISGWTINPLDHTQSAGIRVVGTFIAPTLATGTASGAFTSVTTGNTTADVVYSTVADTAQNWPVNGLQGKMLEILTGTSALQIVPILRNTANTITVPSTSAFGSVGGTYAIREFGTVIDTGVGFAPSIPAANASIATPIQSGIICFNNIVAPSNVEVRFEQLKIALAAPTTGASGLNIQGTPVTWNRGFIGGAGTGSRVIINNSGGVTTNVANSIINPAGASTGFTVQGNGFVLLSSLLAAAGPTFTTTGGSFLSTSGTGQNLQIFNTQVDPHSFGILITGSSVLTLSGVRIRSGGSQCIRCRVIEGNTGAVFINGTGVSLTGATASTGLELQGPTFGNFTSLFIDNTNGTGCSLAYGALLRVNSTSSISSITGTQDVLMDNAATTLATMRAASPKVLFNNYGTRLTE